MEFLKIGNSKKYLVFLHGWGCDKNEFLFMQNYFLDYAKIFVEFDGFGQTKEPENALFVSDYTQKLYDLISQFEIDELVLVGHSFGGRIAIKFAFLHQQGFKKFGLILVDSAGIKPKLSLIKKIKIKKFKHIKKLANKNEKYKQKLNKFGSSDYKMLSDVMKKTFVNVVNEDLSNILKYISCKSLIVWGENDNETKIYMARRLHKFIKNSTLKIISNAGHFCFLDKNQEFLIILDSWLGNF